MDATKVVIENWPKTNQIVEYIPIAIAVIALIVSLYSVYLTRKAFVVSQRPYVWASNYGVIDHEAKTILPIPQRVAFRVKNSPANIIHQEIKISYDNEQLFSFTQDDIVRFPDETSEWSFSISEKEFKEIMKRAEKDPSKLRRMILIRYSSLDGGKEYKYILNQSFEPQDNQWKDVRNEAS